MNFAKSLPGAKKRIAFLRRSWYNWHTHHIGAPSERIFRPKGGLYEKFTALLLALLLAHSLCTMGAAAADETVTIVLEPADDTLLTAEGLALFFVDRDAITEKTETSVSWYKETTKDGKTERELVAEMPLIIKITAVGPRIYVVDGYEPSKELIDLVKNHAPEKDADSEHTYGWHRIFNQNCRWRGLRYGTCKDCFGIEFDLCQGNHSYKNGVCTVCGRSKPGEEPEHVHSFTPWTPLDDGMHHGRECACGYSEMGEHNMETERIQYPNKVVIIERCTICGLEYRSEMA